MEKMNGHPDLLELDALRSGEGTAAVKAHVESCRRCRGLLEEMSRHAAALREAHDSAPLPPAEGEQRILQEISRKRRPLEHLYPALGAVAAAALIIFFSYRGGSPPSDPPATVETAKREDPAPVPYDLGEDAASIEARDVNKDGVFDARDVEKLSRLIAENQPGLEAWDFNGDGVTNLQDVELLEEKIAVRALESEAVETYFGC